MKTFYEKVNANLVEDDGKYHWEIPVAKIVISEESDNSENIRPNKEGIKRAITIIWFLEVLGKDEEANRYRDELRAHGVEISSEWKVVEA